MRKLRAQWKLYSQVALTFVLLGYGFTNCSSPNIFGTEVASSHLPPLPPYHPPASELQVPEHKVMVVNREYVAALFKEVFTSTAHAVPELENLIDRWVFFQGANFGGGCDLYSSYSGKDCGGSFLNSLAAPKVDDNVVRETFRVQACLNILGYDQAVSAALEKMQVTVDTAPTEESLELLYGLFYRGEGPAKEVISALKTLDQSLNDANETKTERWRALLLSVCESPGWQLY